MTSQRQLFSLFNLHVFQFADLGSYGNESHLDVHNNCFHDQPTISLKECDKPG